VVKIPLKNIPAQTFNVVLGGQNCTIDLYYRFGNTYMDLVSNRETVTTGAICRNRASVIQVANNTFAGSLHFLDLLGDKDPYYKSYNSRFILLYLADGEEIPKGLRY
jgi:hypothetical protein